MFKSFIKQSPENVYIDPEEREWNYYKKICNDTEMYQCEQIYHYCKDNGIFEKVGARPEIMELVDLYYSVPYMSEEVRDPIYNSIIIKRKVRSFLREAEAYLNIMAKAELGNGNLYREGWMNNG